MPQRATNFFEVLARAGEAGLGQVGRQFAAGKQQERQNQRQDQMAELAAILDVTQSQQRQESHRQAQLIGAAKLNQANLELREQKRLLDMSPEEREAFAIQQAEVAGRARAAGTLAEVGGFVDPAAPITPLSSEFAGSLPGQIQLAQRGLPAGTDLRVGGLNIAGTPFPEPLKAVKVTSGELNRADKQAQANVLRKANNIYQSTFDQTQKGALEIPAILTLKDFSKVLEHIQATKGRTSIETFGGIDFLSADKFDSTLAGDFSDLVSELQGIRSGTQGSPSGIQNLSIEELRQIEAQGQ